MPNMQRRIHGVMKLLYGTGNQGKFESARKWVEGMEIELCSLRDMKGDIPEVNETGVTPLENARMKAEAYYEAFHMPVFSCDSGLYFKDLEEFSPGVMVRRVGGKELTDEEMIRYYGGLAAKYGPVKAYYKNAICLIMDENERYESMDESLWGNMFLIVSEPHEKGQMFPGFPLDCLSVHMESGRYYYDIQKSEDSRVDHGFRKFFRSLGKLKSSDDPVF